MDAVNTVDGAGQCNRTQGHGDTKVVQQNKEIGLELGNHTPLAKTLEVEINQLPTLHPLSDWQTQNSRGACVAESGSGSGF